MPEQISAAQANGVAAFHINSTAEAHSNPLFDDATLKLTPRGSFPPATSSAPQATAVLSPSNSATGKRAAPLCPEAVSQDSGIAAAVAADLTQQLKPARVETTAALAAKATQSMQDIQSAVAPQPDLATVQRPAVEQLPRSFEPAATSLHSLGPGGLSVLYENQTMRVEREELKSELKLISARVCTCSSFLDN